MCQTDAQHNQFIYTLVAVVHLHAKNGRIREHRILSSGWRVSLYAEKLSFMFPFVPPRVHSVIVQDIAQELSRIIILFGHKVDGVHIYIVKNTLVRPPLLVLCWLLNCSRVCGHNNSTGSFTLFYRSLFL